MNTAASSPAVARLARPSQATLAQKSSCLAGRRLLAADCRKVSVALGRGASVKCVAADEAKPMVGSDPSKLTVSLPAALNIDDIMARLPHRFPFLLVDRIVEWVPGQYAIGIKNVTVNDNFFPGHFPTRPLMPGVLQVEAMAQVGGLVMLTPEVGGSKDNFFFGGVDACRFRKPVLPGDTLVMKVELVKLNKRFGVAKMKAQAFVGDKLACEAELTMVLGSA